MKRYVLITTLFFALAFIAGVVTTEAEAYYDRGYGYGNGYWDNRRDDYRRTDRYGYYRDYDDHGDNVVFYSGRARYPEYEYYDDRPAGRNIVFSTGGSSSRTYDFEEPERDAGDNIVFGYKQAYRPYRHYEVPAEYYQYCSDYDYYFRNSGPRYMTDEPGNRRANHDIYFCADSRYVR